MHDLRLQQADRQVARQDRQGRCGRGRGRSAVGAAASLGGAAAKRTGGLVLAAVGGIVGGAVGAAIWAGVAYGLHREIGWIAWGIGFLVGVGVATLSGGGGGPINGLLAAVIALASVFGGKYVAVSMVVDDAAKEFTRQLQLTEEDAQVMMADQLVRDAEQAGRALRWPEGMTFEDAEEPEHYPKEIWADVQDRWGRMSESERASYSREMQAFLKASIREDIDSIKTEGFVETFGLFDILWIVLAVGTAFSVAAKGGAGED